MKNQQINVNEIEKMSSKLAEQREKSDFVFRMFEYINYLEEAEKVKELLDIEIKKHKEIFGDLPECYDIFDVEEQFLKHIPLK